MILIPIVLGFDKLEALLYGRIEMQQIRWQLSSPVVRSTLLSPGIRAGQDGQDRR